MFRKIVAVWISLMMLLGFVVIVDVVMDVTPPVKAAIITVDDSGGAMYTKIQDAINASNDGDTVFVYNGTYYEYVVVNRTINLTGEDRNTTIIDGLGGGNVVTITADWVNITEFMILHSLANSNIGLIINSDNNTIYNNSIINNDHGILLSSSSNNTIVNNTIANNVYGIFIESSPNNTITNNELFNNGEGAMSGVGIEIESSFNIIIKNNNLFNDGVFIRGSQLLHYNSHTIPSNNFVNNRPLYYYKDCTNLSIDGIPVGELILVNCTNIDVKNIQINRTDFGMEIIYCSDILLAYSNISSNSRSGIWFELSSNSTITGNDFFSNYGGYDIAFLRSSNNTISDNNLSSSPVSIGMDFSSDNNMISNNVVSMTSIYCIIVQKSSNNIIKNNHVFNNWVGITITETSNNNTVADNIIVNNENGIYIDSPSAVDNVILRNNISSNLNYGLITWSTSDNIIFGNDISDNGFGLYMGSSSNHIIWGNLVSNNDYGFYLESSLNNRIYHNNIINNMNQAYDDTTNGNYWNTGYPYGGNHWSDFDEPNENAYDDYQGKNQDKAGSDNIVDKGTIGGPGKNPYVIDGDSQDNYPLISFVGHLFLYEGWNLISIPFIQPDNNLDIVLNSIKGAYDSVQWYNVSDNFDPWKHNNLKKPSRLNDLHNISHTMGFWIHITEPEGVLFQCSGAQPIDNQKITLHHGWNLVGYPSIMSYNRTNGLNNLTFGNEVDSIWTYNTAAHEWKEITESDYFEIGRGYWVHAKTKCEWEVPL
jgi:parallel beta-helix repeat protein